MSNRSEEIRNILVPILSVIMDFPLGTIIMVIFGYGSVVGCQAMFETVFQGKKSIGEIFVTAAPLISTVLGFSVANLAGFFNIELSGQALCGWMVSIQTTLSMPDTPRMIMLPMMIIVRVVAGALATAISGFLRVYFGTSEVIVTVMLNYILSCTGNHIANNVIKPSIMANKGITKIIGTDVSLRPLFLASTGDDSHSNVDIFLAFIFLILVQPLMKKTMLGFEIRSVGLNPFASEYAGISSKRTTILSMMISGTLVDLGDAVQGLGTFQNFSIQNTSLGIGFDDMVVSLSEAGGSVGILLSALLFGMLKLGGQGMPLIAGAPTELVDAVIAAIIFFVGISCLIHFLSTKVSGSKKGAAIIETIEVVPDKSNQEEGDI